MIFSLSALAKPSLLNLQEYSVLLESFFFADYSVLFSKAELVERLKSWEDRKLKDFINTFSVKVRI